MTEIGTSDLEAAVAALDAARPVVIPTDTVYGIAALSDRPEAIRAVFEAKRRPPEKSLPVLAARVEDLSRVVVMDRRARAVADKLWPGPLTLILPRAPGFAHELGPDGETVAVRVPANDIALELLGRTGPLAVTSANRSGEPAATTVSEARAALGDSVEVFVDGGRCAGAASTIVSLVGRPELVRQGPISLDDVVSVIGDVAAANPVNVMFVCTGNLCRSPMAAALMRDAVAKRGCRDIEAVSAGTWADYGYPATAEAVSVLRSRGVDLGPHRSRPLEPEELARADLVVAMTSVHVREILEVAPDAHGKLIMLKELAEIDLEDLPASPSKEDRLDALLSSPRPPARRALDVDDPIGLPLGAYERCVGELEKGVDALVRILCDAKAAG